MGGGAIKAAFRLHDTLRGQGQTSRMLVKRKFGDDREVFEGRAPLSRAEWLWRRLSFYLDAAPTRFIHSSNTAGLSPAWAPERTVYHADGFPADVINLHWVCEGFLRPESIARLNKPLVWTCYDTWPFVGAEHYAGDCRRAIEGYREDNRPSGETGFDLNRWVWNRKRKAWTGVEFTAVAATRWLADLMARSVLFRDRRIEVIPHGADLRLFKPVDRGFARHVLDLPADKTLILFGAMGGLSNHRKGGHFLLDALRRLVAQGLAGNVELVVFGCNAPDQPVDVGVPVHFLGKMDELGLVLAHAAADVFTAPSMEDNLPLTVLEALACARPVVAFGIGGMLDVMRHQENGWLAECFSAEHLAEGLAWVLADPRRKEELGQAGRRIVEAGFGLEHQANAYVKLYQSVMERG